MKKCMLICSIMSLCLFIYFVPSLAAGKSQTTNDYSSLTQSSSNFAENAVKELAAIDRGSKNGDGILSIGLGVGIVYFSYSLIDDLGWGDESKKFPAILGGICIVSGIIIIATPSVSEVEYRNICSVLDPDERKFRAEEALSFLAYREKVARHLKFPHMFIPSYAEKLYKKSILIRESSK